MGIIVVGGLNKTCARKHWLAGVQSCHLHLPVLLLCSRRLQPSPDNSPSSLPSQLQREGKGSQQQCCSRHCSTRGNHQMAHFGSLSQVCCLQTFVHFLTLLWFTVILDYGPVALKVMPSEILSLYKHHRVYLQNVNSMIYYCTFLCYTFLCAL